MSAFYLWRLNLNKVDSKTGTISEKGNVVIPTTHHYGKVSKN